MRHIFQQRHGPSCRGRHRRHDSTNEEETCFFPPQSSNMAAARRLKRVASSQPGFLNLKSTSDSLDSAGRRRRVNKNKKKNWNKHSDVNDIDEFLQDVRHQERTTGCVQSQCVGRRTERYRGIHVKLNLLKPI